MDLFLQELGKKLASNSEIVTDEHPNFSTLLERWTNIGRQAPSAIVLPANESDIALVVKEAYHARIPLVPTIGGHSQWSTIDQTGIIIDLRNYKEIQVDAAQRTVTVKGGLLMKELQIALSQEGQFTTVANGNTVGVIPYAIGGGISSYTPLVGYACENILSAKLIVANGDIVKASEEQHKDLLWAVRGAGQFFGIVTELVLRTYDYSVIGHNGVRQIGTVFFPAERSKEVCETLRQIVSKDDHASAGHFMVMNDPSGKPGRVLLVAPQYFGTGPQLQATFKPIIDLEPQFHQHQDSSFAEHSDHLDWMLPKGEYKRFSQTGMASIHPKNFEKLVDLHQELVSTVPGSERSVFTIEWHTPTISKEVRATETAFGLKNVDIWLNILTWYTDPSYHEQVLEFDKRAQDLMRSDTIPEAYVAYTNTSRDEPIESRYKDEGAVKKLQELKRQWDPTGVFTRELL